MGEESRGGLVPNIDIFVFWLLEAFIAIREIPPYSATCSIECGKMPSLYQAWILKLLKVNGTCRSL